MKPAIIILSAAAILVGTFLIISSLVHNNPVRENQSPTMINTNYMLSISNGTTQVPSHSYTFYHFSAPAGSSTAQVQGDFTMAGNGSNLRIYLLDDVNFNNWRDGHQFNTYYDSKNVTTGIIAVVVPSGKMLYLIYDNTVSLVQSKSVYSKINLVYT